MKKRIVEGASGCREYMSKGVLFSVFTTIPKLYNNVQFCPAMGTNDGPWNHLQCDSEIAFSAVVVRMFRPPNQDL